MTQNMKEYKSELEKWRHEVTHENLEVKNHFQNED